jgi:hypothetical protein
LKEKALIDLTLVGEIEPGRHRTGVAACFAKRWASQEEPTLVARKSRQSDICR